MGRCGGQTCLQILGEGLFIKEKLYNKSNKLLTFNYSVFGCLLNYMYFCVLTFFFHRKKAIV